jgi:metallophosphoesterase superfamily enzyme
MAVQSIEIRRSPVSLPWCPVSQIHSIVRSEIGRHAALRGLTVPRGKRTLFVADVHFGKAAAFRAGGVPLPRGSTATDLERLTRHRMHRTGYALCGDLHPGVRIHGAAGQSAWLPCFVPANAVMTVS